MIPAYFPMTFVSDRTAAALAACFPVTTVYRPAPDPAEPDLRGVQSSENSGWAAARAAPTGRMELRVPVADAGDELRARFAAYREWADRHPGLDMSYLKHFGDAVPFFDETSRASIQAEIRRGRATQPPAPDPLFEARLFLLIAEDYDRHRFEVSRGLQSVDQLNRTLFAHLRGDERDAQPPMADGVEDPGVHLTARRIAAWSMLRAADPAPPELLVTDSRAALDSLIEDRPGTREVLRVRDIPVAPEPSGDIPPFAAWLADHLKPLILGSAPAGEPPVGLAPGDGGSTCELILWSTSGTPEAVLAGEAGAPEDGTGVALIIPAC